MCNLTEFFGYLGCSPLNLFIDVILKSNTVIYLNLQELLLLRIGDKNSYMHMLCNKMCT